MKFNWGTGILIFIIIFVAATIFTAVTLMNKDVDLVTDNYYEKTLVYQDEIDKLNRSVDISGKVDFIYTDNLLSIKFPHEAALKIKSGEISFYRPSNSSLDFNLPFEPDSTGLVVFNTDKITKGLWDVKLKWQQHGKDFLVEKRLIMD